MAKFGFIFKKSSLPLDSSSYVFMYFLQNFRFFCKLEVMKKYGKIWLLKIKIAVYHVLKYFLQNSNLSNVMLVDGNV